MLTFADWERQLERQFRWTKGIREHVYRQVGMAHFRDVLEVGCGTGLVTQELAGKIRGRAVGLDRNPKMVESARRRISAENIKEGEATSLPFEDKSFDAVFCHYFFLWAQDRDKVISELRRVTRPYGWVVALAEPDYGGMIENPDLGLRELHIQSIRREGGNPLVGRELLGFFTAAKLETQVGVVARVWKELEMKGEFEAEWDFLLKVLSEVRERSELEQLKKKEAHALKKDQRLVVLPMFYCLGRRK